MLINGEYKNVNLTYKYIDEEINKEKHKKLLEIFMILDEINKTKNIISFTYNENYLTVQTKVDEYYRIHLKDKKRRCNNGKIRT